MESTCEENESVSGEDQQSFARKIEENHKSDPFGEKETVGL
jgi:hypothetical protein